MRKWAHTLGTVEASASSLSRRVLQKRQGSQGRFSRLRWRTPSVQTTALHRAYVRPLPIGSRRALDLHEAVVTVSCTFWTASPLQICACG